MPLGIRACLVVILLLPSLASAAPIVAGLGDSLTCDSCNDGSYLRLLADYLDPDPIIDENTASAVLTDGILLRLDNWINAGNTADVLVLMTGTVDTYLDANGFGGRDYDPAETLSNIGTIVDTVLAEGIPLVLLAPPPVQPPCANPGVPSCSTIDARLADLAVDLAVLAGNKGVQFLDLYAAFSSHPDFGLSPGSPGSLYLSGGLYPRLSTGDTLIASLVAPLIETALIPEPSTGLLLGTGLLALAQRRRSRRAAA